MPVLLLLLAAGMSSSLQPLEGTSARSLELLRFDCLSTVGRRELTLFGNGTLRLRDGLRGSSALKLLELGPDELDAVLRRLAGEDLNETEPRYDTVDGAWVEACELTLELPASERRVFAFGRYDTLTLSLQRVVGIAGELIDRVAARPPEGARQLPAGYAPQVGDLLRRADGAVFEVMAFTADGLGVELQGRLEPLTIYVPKGQMAEVFVALELPRQ